MGRTKWMAMAITAVCAGLAGITPGSALAAGGDGTCDLDFAQFGLNIGVTYSGTAECKLDGYGLPLLLTARLRVDDVDSGVDCSVDNPWTASTTLTVVTPGGDRTDSMTMSSNPGRLSGRVQTGTGGTGVFASRGFAARELGHCIDPDSLHVDVVGFFAP